ncbi:MAG TPA: OmpH family outer membrane protein [Chthoniobacterales bacterium]|nr:OmpH family outer membrane protein [Chthoniobacterales bacterium]
MKKSVLVTTIGLALLTVSFASRAEAQMKIGTIDMQKVFTAYYKTHDAEDKLKEAQKAYKDELDQRMDEYKKNLDVINKLNEEMNKPELSGAAKDQKAQERDAKISDTKGLEKEISDFRQQRERQIQDQLKRMRDGIVDEIMKVVNDQVKAQNYDIVFDRSGFSANNIVPVLLYSRDNYDFSDSVITKLNANRPAESPAPTAKPATSTNTPATTVKPAGDLGKKPR